MKPLFKFTKTPSETEIQEYPRRSEQTFQEIMDAGTPGEWHLPHFATPDEYCACQCAYIFSDGQGYCGSVATMGLNNGLPISEGGNDNPPFEEAVWNAVKLVTAMRLAQITADPETRTILSRSLPDIDNASAIVDTILKQLISLALKP